MLVLALLMVASCSYVGVVEGPVVTVFRLNSCVFQVFVFSPCLATQRSELGLCECSISHHIGTDPGLLHLESSWYFFLVLSSLGQRNGLCWCLTQA